MCARNPINFVFFCFLFCLWSISSEVLQICNGYWWNNKQFRLNSIPEWCFSSQIHGHALTLWRSSVVQDVERFFFFVLLLAKTNTLRVNGERFEIFAFDHSYLYMWKMNECRIRGDSSRNRYNDIVKKQKTIHTLIESFFFDFSLSLKWRYVPTTCHTPHLASTISWSSQVWFITRWSYLIIS